MAGDAPLLVGPSGCGKTHICEQIATKMDLPFYYIGKVTSDFQLKGFTDAHGNTHKTNFRKAYENGGVFMLDEMDSSDPDALVSINPALDGEFLDAPDGMIERHKDFYFIGAANTWGAGATLDYIGRNALDGATLDRFAMFAMDYDEKIEREIVHDKYGGKQDGWVVTVQQARAAARELELPHIISMRASLRGAALLTQGMKIDKVFKARVLRGLSESNALALTHKIENNGKELLKVFEENSEKASIKVFEAIAKAIAGSIEGADVLEQVKELRSELSELSGEFDKWTESPVKNTVKAVLGRGNKQNSEPTSPQEIS